MKKPIIPTAVLSLILVSCGNQNTESKTDQEEKLEQGNPKDEKTTMLELEASRLRAGGSVKTVELEGKSAKICYVQNYEEYKEINPQSSLTKSDLEGYWESGDAVEKALVDGSVRIMKKLDYIDTVTIILPFRGTTYTIIVNKSDLEKFVKTDFSEIKNNWDKVFSNPYVYNDIGRRSFFSKFGNKE